LSDDDDYPELHCLMMMNTGTVLSGDDDNYPELHCLMMTTLNYIV
jgi:hypothetical protein